MVRAAWNGVRTAPGAAVFLLLALCPAGAQQAVSPQETGGTAVGPPLSIWLHSEVGRQVISTLILLLVVLLARGILVRRVSRMQIGDMAARRRLIVNIRNGAHLMFVAGCFIVWATELRTLALSLFAITAAIVIATKELILCLSGGLYRTLVKNCKIGDRIEISNFRGDIIDQAMLYTTILETGPGQQTQQHTGRVVVLPNAVFLSAPLINESYTRDYVAHTFQVPVGADGWERGEEILLRACREEVTQYLDEARRFMHELEVRHGFEAPSVDPRVIARVPEAGKVLFIARVCVPARLKGRVEQAIVRRFLKEFYGGSQRDSRTAGEKSTP
jgi:small-conductance mechanosensitive channel